MLRLLTVAILLTFPNIAQSQKQGNVWVFGDSSGINFNFSPPQVFSSSVRSLELTSSVADTAGNLLFYNSSDNPSSGSLFPTSVWNKLNQVMPNGSLLLGSPTVTQGSLILDKPGDTSLFYIFQINQDQGIGLRLHYSVVNLNLDNGNGDVTFKNILLLNDTITEKMQAIRHGNGRDWWLVLHKNASSIFYKYLISPSGINGPYIQNIGIPFANLNYGQMDFSPNGNKLSFSNLDGLVELFDFDRCNGAISNEVSLGNSTADSSTARYYGCAFSPNSKVLYISTFDSIFQFCLDSPNVAATKYLLFHEVDTNYNIGQLKLGPDNKLYVTHTEISGSTGIDFKGTHLSVNVAPDVYGTSAFFLPYSFSLNNRKSYFGLPNIPNYKLGRLVGSPCDTLTGIKEIAHINNVTLHPTPACNKVQITSKQKINFYTLTTAAGALVQEQKIKQQNSFEINVKELSSGVYFLKLQSDKGFVVRKVVRE